MHAVMMVVPDLSLTINEPDLATVSNILTFKIPTECSNATVIVLDAFDLCKKPFLSVITMISLQFVCQLNSM